jgi:hypothetical protein
VARLTLSDLRRSLTGAPAPAASMRPSAAHVDAQRLCRLARVAPERQLVESLAAMPKRKRPDFLLWYKRQLRRRLIGG